MMHQPQLLQSWKDCTYFFGKRGPFHWAISIYGLSRILDCCLLVTVYLCGWMIQHCIVKWGVAQAVTEEQIITHHGRENKERQQWGKQTYLILTWRQSLLQSRGELQQCLWTERFWSLPHSTLSSLEESCEEECYCGQGALIYHLDIWHPGLCRHDPSKTSSAYSGRRGGTPGK